MWPMAQALLRLNIHHGLVVHGADGLDEVTTTGETSAIEIRSGGKTHHFSPIHVGLSRASLNQLRGGVVETNVEIAHNVLNGKATPQQRDIVALNAGCVIYTADQTNETGGEFIGGIKEGIEKAFEALESGRARTVLERAIEMSHS